MADNALAAVARHVRRAACPLAEQSDQELLQDFAANHDEAAFAALVRRHGPTVLGVCRRVLGHAQDAEDAFQATFLVLARQAGSIRRQGSLASWLHGVSLRVALKARRAAARRRRHEGCAGPAGVIAPAELPWGDVQAALDEEIAALPAIYRSVFVLCALEGHSKTEAAGQLGLKAGTVSSRLAGARRRLQQRLVRRGITLGALTVLSAAAVPGAVAGGLARAAVLARLGQACGGGVSAQAQALAKGAMTGMVAHKLKMLAGVVVLLGSLVAGLSARPGPPAAPAAKPADRKQDGAVTVQGRVYGADGKPAAGAKLFLWPRPAAEKKAPAPRTTDREGRFRFTVPAASADTGGVVVATAAGQGPGWATLAEAARKEATLRLVKDVPIEGRLIDLEGRPVAGAVVRLRELERQKG